ncbi:hypothetical protein J8273_6830 [Carpediemonas membranifera]|uniref:Uncharacterized protein n=1 Tax=Carpediemonas membranifera TaxID=201153 RepID=A0A8J6AQT8_9EUKA|nr:hypothetical protein J8273_6830 [Carpediemonas membranifera]|eukprot:KAG9391876.1 hypothetical protein J8273_6830 [Carpediemonas membranifera]
MSNMSARNVVLILDTYYADDADLRSAWFSMFRNAVYRSLYSICSLSYPLNVSVGIATPHITPVIDFTPFNLSFFLTGLAKMVDEPNSTAPVSIDEVAGSLSALMRQHQMTEVHLFTLNAPACSPQALRALAAVEEAGSSLFVHIFSPPSSPPNLSGLRTAVADALNIEIRLHPRNPVDVSRVVKLTLCPPPALQAAITLGSTSIPCTLIRTVTPFAPVIPADVCPCHGHPVFPQTRGPCCPESLQLLRECAPGFRVGRAGVESTRTFTVPETSCVTLDVQERVPMGTVPLGMLSGMPHSPLLVGPPPAEVEATNSIAALARSLAQREQALIVSFHSTLPTLLGVDPVAFTGVSRPGVPPTISVTPQHGILLPSENDGSLVLFGIATAETVLPSTEHFQEPSDQAASLVESAVEAIRARPFSVQRLTNGADGVFKRLQLPDETAGGVLRRSEKRAPKKRVRIRG